MIIVNISQCSSAALSFILLISLSKHSPIFMASALPLLEWFQNLYCQSCPLESASVTYFPLFTDIPTLMSPNKYAFHPKPLPSPYLIFIFENRNRFPTTYPWSLRSGRKDGNNSQVYQGQTTLIHSIIIRVCASGWTGSPAPCYSAPPNGCHMEEQAQFFQMLFFKGKHKSCFCCET